MADHPSTDDQMRLAMKAMAAHIAQSERVDRTGWTDEEWIADARRLMDDIDGSVMSLVNGHVLALLSAAEQRDDGLRAALARAAERIRHDHAYPMEFGPHHCDGCDLEADLRALLTADTPTAHPAGDAGGGA